MEELTPAQKLCRCKKRLAYLKQTLKDKDFMLSAIIKKAVEDDLKSIPVKSEYGQDIIGVITKFIAMTKDVNVIL